VISRPAMSFRWCGMLAFDPVEIDLLESAQTEVCATQELMTLGPAPLVFFVSVHSKEF
jgi:hypothetical protein